MKLNFLFTFLFVTALANELFEAIEPDEGNYHPRRGGGVQEPERLMDFLDEEEEMLPSKRALAALPKAVYRCARRCVKICSQKVPPGTNRTRWRPPVARRELQNCTNWFVTTKCRNFSNPNLRTFARKKCRMAVTTCGGDRLCPDNYCVASGTCCTNETMCMDGNCVANATSCHNTTLTSTKKPTSAPASSKPTRAPTPSKPTRAPTPSKPTRASTKKPTRAPTLKTSQPPRAPTTKTTHAPTNKPTQTRAPTLNMSKPPRAPTKKTTQAPTKKPTHARKTSKATLAPTQNPTPRLRCKGDGRPCLAHLSCCSGVCGANGRCIGY